MLHENRYTSSWWHDEDDDAATPVVVVDDYVCGYGFNLHIKLVLASEGLLEGETTPSVFKTNCVWSGWELKWKIFWLNWIRHLKLTKICIFYVTPWKWHIWTNKECIKTFIVSSTTATAQPS